MQKTYAFKARVWLYEGFAPWHFVTLPQKTAREIDYFFMHSKRGWGSLPVQVTILRLGSGQVGKTTWSTSIFTDKKSDSYLLPLKADVRKKAGIKKGDTISISLEIMD